MYSEMSVNSGIDRFDHSASLRLRHVGGICKESNGRRGCICALLPGDYPRIAGAGPGHVRLLAESEAALPPILVQRSTLRVVDGMHRLRAALLRGESEMAVEYFDGSEQMAFPRSVRANLTHGLPLSRSDREAAIVKIISVHPDWSDRMIAASTGVSGKTAAAIRGRSALPEALVITRVGADRRMSPVDAAEGRSRAAEILSARTEASLREVARASGIAVGTGRDVRERMGRGEDPIPVRQQRVATVPARHRWQERVACPCDQSAQRTTWRYFMC